MEISDQRYQELVATIGTRQRESACVVLAGQTSRTQPDWMAARVRAKSIDHHPARLAPAREVKDILLVDPDSDGIRAARNSLRFVADVETCSEFRVARARLFAKPPDLLVTNLRLRDYNGLHLVHLAAGTATRCIAYSAFDDLVLAREVQAAGAFYERLKQLPRALASYVNALLPSHDRRSPNLLDRRKSFRGGRRCADR